MTPNEQIVVDYIIQHNEGLRDYVREQLRKYMPDEENYKGLLDIYQMSYEILFMVELKEYLTAACQVGYDDVCCAIDFETVKKLWNLDERGRNL